ncbi:MAG: glycosyltransferase family 4 protein [Actinomycetota bacterium]
MSRVLLVAPYPPRTCGIGAYAAAQAERLRSEGHEVTVLSPPDGHGDVRVGFFGGRPFRAAARLGKDADRIVVHFQPALYFKRRAPLSKIGASLGLERLCRTRPQTEILVHEADPPRWWRPDEFLLRRAFRRAPLLLFHTDAERVRFERTYRVRRPVRLVPHIEGVRVHGRMTRTEARRRLGIPEGERVLVSAGFLHPAKGHERAIEAVRRAGAGRLYIVGSARDDSPRNEEYARRIRGMAAAAPGVELVEGFASDEDFDTWIAAADAVVLPYRRSWSSGALARAHAVGTPAVVTGVGGLAEQAGPRDIVVGNDDELAAAVAAVLTGRTAEVRP